jgi:hypothetical protein
MTSFGFPFWQLRKLKEALPPLKPLLGGDIKDITCLWYFIAQDSDQDINVSAELKTLARTELIALMVEQGVREANSEDVSNLGRLWITLRRCWLEVAILASLFMLIVLGLRAFGYLAFLPPPLGLSEKVVIAARNLESGRQLQAGDLYTARLPPRFNYFVAPGESPEGLVIKPGASLSRFRPIHYNDLLRLQVLAKRDITEHATITEEDLVLAWSAYQPDALTKTSQALNQHPRHTIPSGTVLSRNFLYTLTPAGQGPPSH